MSRDVRLYLEDILTFAQRVASYTQGMDQAGLVADTKTYDAVIRNLELVGEACKKVPQEFRTAHPEIEWRKMAGFRDTLIHAYFHVDEDIVWDVVENKVPALITQVQRILAQGSGLA